MVHELELRIATCECINLSTKGKEFKVGTKQLISVLKRIVYPSEKEEKRGMSNKEKENFKCFERVRLNSLQWDELITPNPNLNLDDDSES